MIIINGGEPIPEILSNIEGYVSPEIAEIKTETDKIPAEVVKTAAIKVETDKMPATIIKVDTLLSNQEIQLEHIHGAQKTYPTLANGVTVTGGAAAWALGNYVEVVPANGIQLPFDIHWVGIGVTSAVGEVYEVELFKGALGSEIEIGQFRAYRAAQQAGAAPSPMLTEILPANTRISARSANAGGGNATISIALFYHTY